MNHTKHNTKLNETLQQHKQSATATPSTSSLPPNTTILPNTRYLKFHITTGTQFNIPNNNDIVSNNNKNNNKVDTTQYQLIVTHNNTKYTSKLLNLCTTTPQFNLLCLFPIAPLTVTMTQLLDHRYIPICITLIGKSGTVNELITTQYIDYRSVLIHGKLTQSIQLYSHDMLLNQYSTIGVIQCDSEILPLKLPSQHNIKPVFNESDTVHKHICTQQQLYNTVITKFNTYIKSYWNEYIAINPDIHNKRLIKLYGTSEHCNHSTELNHYSIPQNQFVCQFIQPLYTNRLLCTPSHCQRYVKLIAYKSNISLGGEHKSIWYNSNTVTSLQSCDTDNHTILLCNLLLGFQLDCYVCIGSTINSEMTSFVLMRDGINNIWIYDAVNGTKYRIEDTATNIPYKSIYCIFNHKSYYSNIQQNDHIISCNYMLENATHWKSMSTQAINLLPKLHSTCTLQSTHNQLMELEYKLELQVKQLLTAYRHDVCKLDTVYDSDVEYILQVALDQYELDRIYTQQPSSNTYNEFELCIKHVIPVDHTFSAVPLHCTSIDTNQLMNRILSNNNSSDIVIHTEYNTRHALRIKLYSYPENIYSVWMLLASVRYVK